MNILPPMAVVVSSRSSEEAKQDVSAIKKATRKVTKSKAAARKYLIEKGFMTEGGNLTSRYKR